MIKEEIRNKVVQFFKQNIQSDKITIPEIYSFVESGYEYLEKEKKEIFSIAREIIQEFINNGLLYPGRPEKETLNDHGYPWLTITSCGKECFKKENWLPYDPDGYIKELKEKILDIDSVTLLYISESIATYNRRNFLSATLTLGVASENLMLLLIESYICWIHDEKKKNKLKKKIKDQTIFTQYKIFKKEFDEDIKNFPKELKNNSGTYLENIFNFIRLNRNEAGHPTGKKFNAKIIYANQQIFTDYADYIFKLINYFKTK